MDKNAIAIFGTILASFVLAMVVVRVPALWTFIPAWLDHGVSKLLKVGSQETSSIAEFLAAWIFSFGLLCVVVFATLVALKWRVDKPS